MIRPVLCSVLAVLTLTGCATSSRSTDMVRGAPISFTGSEDRPNGAWCWFQDERAIVDANHPDRPVLLFTAVSAAVFPETESGDLDLYWYELESGIGGSVELHDRLEQDDHNVAALHVLPDGRAMAAYAKHGTDRNVRTRMSRVHDPTQWSRESIHTERAGVTYNNLLTAGPSKTLLNFSRSRGWNPNFLVFDLGSKTWTHGGRLLASDGRPYLKYRNTRDGERIHVVATDQHPRDYDNSIYHGIVAEWKLTDSFGDVIDPEVRDDEAVAPSDMTVVFQGDPDNVAWMADVEVDRDDNAVIAFSVQKDGRGLPPQQGGYDHRYHLARFIDGEWVQHEIAYAGERLYAFEDDYTGLVAIDPQDPNTLVISTNADPDTGEPLISLADGKRHYELYQGVSKDDGASFSWKALTSNSSVDNLRPIIPSWESDRRIILWMRGTYRSYTDWDTQIVGLIQQR